jgi:hypothetical protein
VSPNVDPARRATARARSSAAPRDAATITSSVAGGRPLRNSRAASSRAAADVEVTMRMHELLPDALPDNRMNAAPAAQKVRK